MGITSKMTDRQAAAWPFYINRLNQVYRAGEVPSCISCWDFAWGDEIRPGRGRDFSAFYCDGEILAQITMDPYGAGDESIASLQWFHASADEECTCSMCTKNREDG